MSQWRKNPFSQASAIADNQSLKASTQLPQDIYAGTRHNHDTYREYFPDYQEVPLHRPRNLLAGTGIQRRRCYPET